MGFVGTAWAEHIATLLVDFYLEYMTFLVYSIDISYLGSATVGWAIRIEEALCGYWDRRW